MSKIVHKDAANLSVPHKVSEAEWKANSSHQDEAGNTLEVTLDTDTDVKAKSWVVDEDDLSSDLDTKVPTQQSVKAYVGTRVICPATDVELQAAIDAGSGKVLVQGGECLLSAMVTVPDNTEIEIAEGTTVKIADGADITAAFSNADSVGGNTNIYIHGGGQIDGNRTNQTAGGTGVFLDNCTWSKVGPIRVVDSYTHGVRFDNCQHSQMIQPHVSNIRWMGVELYDCDHCGIIEPLCYDCDEQGVEISTSNTYCYVIAPMVVEAAGNGIEIAGGNSHIEIISPQVYNTGQRSSTTETGGHGISIEDDDVTVTDPIIDTVRENYQGISVTDDKVRVKIVNPKISNIAGASGGTGIYLRAGTKYCEIINPQIRLCAYSGIRLRCSQWNTITGGKLLDNTAYGLRMDDDTVTGCDYNTITGVTATDTREGGSKTQTHGIAQLGIGDYNTVLGCNLAGNATAGSVGLPAANDIVRSDIGYTDNVVTGPASATDNAIARFNGTTGKIIQDYTSGAPTIDDTGVFISGAYKTKIDPAIAGVVIGDGSSWDMGLIWGEANNLYVWDYGSSYFGHLITSFLKTASGVLYLSSNTPFAAPTGDNEFMYFTAKDNGVASVEVARLQGAADPYFSMGGSQEFKFYNSGIADLGNGAITNANIDSGDIATGVTIAGGATIGAHTSRHAVGGADSVFPADPGEDKYLMWDDSESAFAFGTPAGAGDVSKVGTPADGEVGIWTGDGTIEGAYIGTLCVASNDATDYEKNQAKASGGGDPCDGTDDEVQLQAANDLAAATGRKVRLLGQNFYIQSANYTITTPTEGTTAGELLGPNGTILNITNGRQVILHSPGTLKHVRLNTTDCTTDAGLLLVEATDATTYRYCWVADILDDITVVNSGTKGGTGIRFYSQNTSGHDMGITLSSIGAIRVRNFTIGIHLEADDDASASSEGYINGNTFRHILTWQCTTHIRTEAKNTGACGGNKFTDIQMQYQAGTTNGIYTVNSNRNDFAHVHAWDWGAYPCVQFDATSIRNHVAGVIGNVVDVLKSNWNVVENHFLPVKYLWLPASEGIPSITSGCAALAHYETPTTKLTIPTLDFDDGIKEYAEWTKLLPYEFYTYGKVKARFYWFTSGGNTGSVVWGIYVSVFKHGTDLDAALGTPQETTHTNPNNTLRISSSTAAIVTGGYGIYPIRDYLCKIKVYRDGGTLTDDARLVGVLLEYNIPEESYP